MKSPYTPLDTPLEKFIKGVGLLDQFQTVWGLFFALILVCVFIYCLLEFKKGVNRDSRKQIKQFINIHKYEPSLYIELNRNVEYMRYFIHAYRWKDRLIRQYNQLFKGFEGKKLQKALKGILTYRLSRFSSVETIRRELLRVNQYFEAFRKERHNDLDQYGNYYFVMRNLAYDYIKATDHLLKLCDMIQEKAVIIVGSAGNGKTNLMCRMSELAIANSIPLMLINAKDIDTSCVDYILNKLPLFKRFKNFSFLYLKIISIFLYLRRKYFYILIDAVNENDRDAFIKSIGNMLDCFHDYKRIRLVFSCRSEYFDSRFRAFFESSSCAPYKFDMLASEYDARASKKMLITYAKHFNVKCSLTSYAQVRLLRSLFLMRIFFEVNSGHEGNISELRNAVIYLEYLKKVSSEVTTFDFLELVNSIAEKMLDNSKYDNIKLSDLAISITEYEKLFQVLDDNLFVSRTISVGNGITERTYEIIYFVFDELRDFCLARYLLTSSEDVGDSSYHLFFQKASDMFENRQSPIEGVLKYGYFHFKSNGLVDLAQQILDKYGESNIQNFIDRNRWHEREQRTFLNFGLSLILIDGGAVNSFEFSYIQNYINKYQNHYWDIFWFLLANEYASIHPDLELALQLLLHDRTLNSIEEIVKYFFADMHDYRYRSSDDRRRLDTLCIQINQFKKLKGDLSISFKQLLVVLSAFYPYEYQLNEYHDMVLDDAIFLPLLECIQDQDIIDSLYGFKSLVSEGSDVRHDMHQLLLSLLQGGDDDDDD